MQMDSVIGTFPMATPWAMPMRASTLRDRVLSGWHEQIFAQALHSSQIHNLASARRCSLSLNYGFLPSRYGPRPLQQLAMQFLNSPYQQSPSQRKPLNQRTKASV